MLILIIVFLFYFITGTHLSLIWFAVSDIGKQTKYLISFVVCFIGIFVIIWILLLELV